MKIIRGNVIITIMSIILICGLKELYINEIRINPLEKESVYII